MATTPMWAVQAGSMMSGAPLAQRIADMKRRMDDAGVLIDLLKAQQDRNRRALQDLQVEVAMMAAMMAPPPCAQQTRPNGRGGEQEFSG